MRELAYLFIGISVGMLSPIETSFYVLIPLSIGIIFYLIGKGEVSK